MQKSDDQNAFAPLQTHAPLLTPAARKQAMATLQSNATLAKAARIIALKSTELRGAVLGLIEELEAAVKAADWPSAFAAMHEIRGLAGTAGLAATGRIANGFCRYLDALKTLGAEPDPTVAMLHRDALVRSARTEDEAERHGDAVVQQLAALVQRKLAEIKK